MVWNDEEIPNGIDMQLDAVNISFEKVTKAQQELRDTRKRVHKIEKKLRYEQKAVSNVKNTVFGLSRRKNTNEVSAPNHGDSPLLQKIDNELNDLADLIDKLTNARQTLSHSKASIRGAQEGLGATYKNAQQAISDMTTQYFDTNRLTFDGIDASMQNESEILLRRVVDYQVNGWYQLFQDSENVQQRIFSVKRNIDDAHRLLSEANHVGRAAINDAKALFPDDESEQSDDRLTNEGISTLASLSELQTDSEQTIRNDETNSSGSDDANDVTIVNAVEQPSERPETGSDLETFQCDYCKYIFLSRSRLVNHMFVHTRKLLRANRSHRVNLLNSTPERTECMDFDHGELQSISTIALPDNTNDFTIVSGQLSRETSNATQQNDRRESIDQRIVPISSAMASVETSKREQNCLNVPTPDVDGSGELERGNGHDVLSLPSASELNEYESLDGTLQDALLRSFAENQVDIREPVGGSESQNNMIGAKTLVQHDTGATSLNTLQIDLDQSTGTLETNSPAQAVTLSRDERRPFLIYQSQLNDVSVMLTTEKHKYKIVSSNSIAETNCSKQATATRLLQPVVQSEQQNELTFVAQEPELGEGGSGEVVRENGHHAMLISSAIEPNEISDYESLNGTFQDASLQRFSENRVGIGEPDDENESNSPHRVTATTFFRLTSEADQLNGFLGGKNRSRQFEHCDGDVQLLSTIVEGGSTNESQSGQRNNESHRHLDCTQQRNERIESSDTDTASMSSDGVAAISSGKDLVKKTKEINTKRRFECFLCPFRTKRCCVLKRHMKIHTGAKPSKCGGCGKRFSVKTSLHKRSLEGTKKQPVQCAICKGRFTQKGYLNLHMRIHTLEKPFKCNVCERAFSRKDCLNRHLLSHQRSRVCKCRICKTEFSDKLRLRGHFVAKHKRIRMYECYLCRYWTQLQTTLKFHMLTHTGERPFECTSCGKGFIRKGNLTQHMKTKKCKAQRMKNKKNKNC